MNIVYTVYHDLNKEARSMEMLNSLVRIGNVHLISYAVPNNVSNVKTYLINKQSPFALISFINKAKKIINSIRPEVIVLHDNDSAVLIPYIKSKSKDSIIIYDSSELYIKEKWNINRLLQFNLFQDGFNVWLKQKLTGFRLYYERKYLKEVDYVFAANIERAEIMKEYFSLDKMPSIFNNIHRIDEQYDESYCHSKYHIYFDTPDPVILFGGGISEERKTFDYIKSIKKSKHNVKLLIVGSASQKALKKYSDLIAKEKLDSVVNYIGYVPRSDLKYLMQHSSASVVIFDTDSFNTLYCESGKCYESLFEGTPILASENPPLKRLCDMHNVGVSDDDYAFAIDVLFSDYSKYVDGAKEYIESIRYDDRESNLTAELKEVIYG